MLITYEKEKPKTISLAERRAFLRLPMNERRAILLKQAKAVAKFYESESEKKERNLWQGGDIIES